MELIIAIILIIGFFALKSLSEGLQEGSWIAYAILGVMIFVHILGQ